MNLLFLIGRFHPLLVHFPIGILILAFIFECLSHSKRFVTLRPAVGPALLTGAISAIASSISGYLLSNEGGYDEALLQWHQFLGIATAVFSVLAYFTLAKTGKTSVRILVLLALTILLSVTGHLGGSLTHGEEFLFASGSSPEVIEKIVISQTTISNPAEANVFEEVVAPILSQKCYNCHSSKKQKGQLRLDTREGLAKGGKNGNLLDVGHPEKSELLKRILLPIEDEHHMPPEEREQLTTAETEVIKSWIEEGAPFDKDLKELNKPHVIEAYIQEFSSRNTTNDFPVADREPANPKIIQELIASGVKVSLAGMSSNYLVVSFSLKKRIDEKDISSINAVAKNIVELDLSECEILPDQLKALSEMPELRRLVFTRSSVTDDELAQLPLMSNLVSINLNATRVSGAGVLSLRRMPSLQKIFLFQTEVTKNEFADLRKAFPQSLLDSGNYRMPVLVSDTIIYEKK